VPFQLNSVHRPLSGPDRWVGLPPFSGTPRRSLSESVKNIEDAFRDSHCLAFDLAITSRVPIHDVLHPTIDLARSRATDHNPENHFSLLTKRQCPPPDFPLWASSRVNPAVHQFTSLPCQLNRPRLPAACWACTEHGPTGADGLSHSSHRGCSIR